MGRIALRIAAVCTCLTAATTFLLWYLPQLVTADATALQMPLEPAYMGRLWVNFFHVILALFGYAAAASLWRKRSVTLAAIGFVAMLCWALLEATGVAVNIFAVNGAWRPAMSSSPTHALEANLAWFKAWWNAVFFVLLICFLIGTTALGAVAAAGRGLEFVVGALMLLATPLTIFIILGGYFGMAAFDPIVNVIYPALQPISRLLLGVWLWKSAKASVA